MRRTFHCRLTLPLCLLALTCASQAVATNHIKTVKDPPTQTRDTTFKSETTYENFGTKAKPDWRRIETRRTQETPRPPPNSTIIDREIKIRKYAKGSKRVTELVTITEVVKPVFKLESTITSRTTTTTTFGRVGGKRKKVKKVVETWSVGGVPRAGNPVATGTRVTTTYGRGGKTVTETLNPRTGRWQVVKPPSAGKKKAASSKGPVDAQQKGLPTAAPGQRGIAIPEVPQTGSYGGKNPKLPPEPKY